MKNSNNLYESLPREYQRGLHKDTYWLKCNSLTTGTRLGESFLPLDFEATSDGRPQDHGNLMTPFEESSQKFPRVA
jgi:hypothetical protein